MIARPPADEYAPFYADYVQRVPEGSDIMQLLRRQPDELSMLLQAVPDAQANQHPAPDEWSIKEVIGHICDIERVWAYQALRCARGDATPLPGFDYAAYVRIAGFNTRKLDDLVEEFSSQRHANVLCFETLTEAETARGGVAGDFPMTVRARLYMMAGHVMHHVTSLQVDYQVAPPLSTASVA